MHFYEVSDLDLFYVVKILTSLDLNRCILLCSFVYENVSSVEGDFRCPPPHTRNCAVPAALILPSAELKTHLLSINHVCTIP